MVVAVAPETHLGLMARDLAEAGPLWRRRVSAASIEAVAHAFAMLGLVSAEGAEAAMRQASQALGLRGAGGAALGALHRPARDYRNLRAQGRAAPPRNPRPGPGGGLPVS